MLGLGKLVSFFIWTGLFFGLLIFIATSVLLLFVIINTTLKLEDKIRAGRLKRRLNGNYNI